MGRKLAEALLDEHRHRHDAYPRKVAFTLWPSDFIGTEGATIGQIFYLLGVQPIWDPFGRVADLRLMPAADLGRPRIDVVVQTAGQLRDLAASRLALINRAVAMAAEARDADAHANFVHAGRLRAEEVMKEKGLSPADARRYSTLRVFGGVNGNYGTAIMEMVERGDRWEDDAEVAGQYLRNMGAVYDEGELWSFYAEGIFEAALADTEIVVQPRESHTWGALSLDHVYEFMGGLSMAVRHVTGKDADAYFRGGLQRVRLRQRGPGVVHRRAGPGGPRRKLSERAAAGADVERRADRGQRGPGGAGGRDAAGRCAGESAARAAPGLAGRVLRSGSVRGRTARPAAA